MQEQSHLNATGKAWIRERLGQLSRISCGWAEEVRAIEIELSQVDQDTVYYKGRDSEGLAYLKMYADALSARRASLVKLVSEGNYARFRG